MNHKPLAASVFICLMCLAFESGLAQYYQVKRFKKRFDVPANQLLEVNIDIDAAEVRMEASPRRREARVTIYYVEDMFNVRVSSDFDERHSRLDIEFERKKWVHSDDDDVKAEAIIELPAGVEIDLEANVKAGEVDIDFGGLALAGLDLTTWAGEVSVDFSEPNKTRMDYLRINTKIGETHIDKLGNARFKRAEINGGIGELQVDFRGQLLYEAVAKVDLDIGETDIVLPREVGIKMAVSKFLFLSDFRVPKRFTKSGRYYFSQNYDHTNHELELHISPGLGELKIGY